MSAIAGAFQAFNAVKAIGKSMVDTRDKAMLNEKAIEFQAALLEAQSSMFAVNEERSSLLQRIEALEKELAGLRSWERERARYELKTLDPGIFVYALKDGDTAGEPPHFICPTCYQRGKKSILHSNQGETRGRYHLKCNECKSDDLLVGKSEFHRPRSGGSWMGM
jgi:hypothetical protein